MHTEDISSINEDDPIVISRVELTILAEDQDIQGLDEKLRSLGAPLLEETLNSVSLPLTAPLVEACKTHNLEALKKYVQYGADTNITDGRGQNPFAIIVMELDYATKVEVYAQVMQCGLYMMQHNSAKDFNAKYCNHFIIYLIKMHKYAQQMRLIYPEYFDVCAEAYAQLQPEIENFTALYGARLTQYTEEVVRAGQILGVELAVDIYVPNAGITVKSEPIESPYAKMYLDDVLREYAEFADLPRATKQCFIQLKLAFENSNPDLEIINTGWRGHEIYVARYQDKLILCNRGQYHSDKTFGVKIFKLKNAIVDMTKFYQRFASPLDFERKLSAFVDLSKPLHNFTEIKGQMHGTCAFANAKSIIMPILHLMGEQDAYARYKSFTAWMRDREVSHFLVKFMQAKIQKNEAARLLYFQLLCKYLVNMYAREFVKHEVKKADVRRFERILEVFGTFKKGREVMAALNSEQGFTKLGEEQIVISIEPFTPVQQLLPGVAIDLNTLICKDADLGRIIIDNFKSRQMDLAVLVELAKSDTKTGTQLNKDVSAAIVELEADWTNFLKATGKDQLMTTAREYVERRRNVWVLSSLFSGFTERDNLQQLESILKQKM